MNLKYRYEFIGLDSDGETVTGFLYAHNEQEVKEFLVENEIEDYAFGLAGFLPDPCLLSWKDITLLRSWSGDKNQLRLLIYLCQQWKSDYLSYLEEE